MFKKILLGFVLFVILVFLGIIIFEKVQPNNFSKTLSSRSKEFIKKKEVEQGSSLFSGLLQGKKEDTRGKKIEIEKCFSFIMPFSVFNARQEGECDVYFGLERPRGSIVAFKRSGDDLSFDNLEGVSFRRQNKETYKESTKEIGGKTFLFFLNTSDGYQKTAYYYKDGYYFVITLSVSSDASEADFEQLLASLRFIN